MWYWYKVKHIDQWNTVRAWEKVPHVYSQMIFDKVSRPLNGDRIVSLSVIGEIGCLYTEKIKLDLYLKMYRNDLKMN